MLSELCEPGVANEDALLSVISCLEREALLLCICDHVLHVLVLEGTEDAEEEVSLWKLARELLL